MARQVLPYLTIYAATKIGGGAAPAKLLEQRLLGLPLHGVEISM
jgi:hypothetical protein